MDIPMASNKLAVTPTLHPRLAYFLVPGGMPRAFSGWPDESLMLPMIV
jgi:hypothetical protein